MYLLLSCQYSIKPSHRLTASNERTVFIISKKS